MLTIVRLSKTAKKDLLRVPHHVVVHLTKWVEDVEHRGLEELRKIPGYHDEPLQGKRKGGKIYTIDAGLSGDL